MGKDLVETRGIFGEGTEGKRTSQRQGFEAAK
jgi:hypothetical protein